MPNSSNGKIIEHINKSEIAKEITNFVATSTRNFWLCNSAKIVNKLPHEPTKMKEQIMNAKIPIRVVLFVSSNSELSVSEASKSELIIYSFRSHRGPNFGPGQILNLKLKF